MSERPGPSILEYARFYGLASDHRTSDPLKELANTVSPLHIDDPPGVFHIDRSNGTPLPERLSVSKDAASLLSSLRFVREDAPHFDEDILPEVHRIRHMKIELPLLRTDHELDMRKVSTRIVPDFEKQNLPLEKVDDELDEGLAWPSSYHELPSMYLAKSTSEKIEVTKDTFLFLQSALKLCGGEGQTQDGFQHECPVYNRNTALHPVTPPLLPMSPFSLPFVPSSDIAQLEMLSDHTSPTRKELYELDEQLMKEDGIRRNDMTAENVRLSSNTRHLDSESFGNIYSPLKGMCELPSSPPLNRVRARDLKVEGPLTPPRSERPPPWKAETILYRETLLEVIPDLPPPVPRPEDISSGDIDALFAEIIQPIAETVDRDLEREQLQEADTTLRVAIPVMDFSRPVLPWKTPGYHHNAQDVENTSQKLISDIKTKYLSSHFWPISGKAQQSLQWVPFPTMLGTAAINECITGDTSVLDLVAQPQCMDSDTLTWKPDGLRILDENESDNEDIEYGHFTETADMDSLIRKRKFEFQIGDSVNDDAAVRKYRSSSHVAVDFISLKAVTNVDHGRATDKPHSRESTLLGGQFSAFEALNDFMAVRKGEVKRPRMLESTYDPMEPEKRGENNIQKEPACTTPEIASHKIPGSVSNLVPKLSAPPRAFVVSATFISHLKLLRRVQQLYPTAELIERDFSLHLNPSQPFTRNKEPVTSHLDTTMADEADIIISPGIGLIYTTLQQIKQRSLPGLMARSPVRDRIRRTAPRYERLLVLVSGQSTIDQRAGVEELPKGAMNAHDCEAIIGLIGFCGGLHEKTQMIFVGGGEEELAQWIVNLMVKYSVTSSEVKLLQDETSWEVFLRRAGMNAFGAQVVLADLKAPELSQADTVGVNGGYGLTSFVKMSLDERLKRFEHKIGGTRLLCRVSSKLDARW